MPVVQGTNSIAIVMWFGRHLFWASWPSSGSTPNISELLRTYSARVNCLFRYSLSVSVRLGLKYRAAILEASGVLYFMKSQFNDSFKSGSARYNNVLAYGNSILTDSNNIPISTGDRSIRTWIAEGKSLSVWSNKSKYPY